MHLPLFDKARRAAYALGYVWLRQRSGVAQDAVVFIVGAPRSGTTLLQDRVSRHPGLFSVKAETGFFARDNVWIRARHWTGLRGEAMQRVRGGDLVAQFSSFIAAARDLADAGDRIFVEKTPQHILYLDFLLASFPNARVLHIFRDPRACYASSKSHPNIPQKTPASYARYWTRCLESRLALRDPRIMDISYADLVRQPDNVLNDAMRFLDLDFDPAQVAAAAGQDDRRASHAVFARLAQPINADSLETWRQTLSPAEIATVEQYAGPYVAASQSGAAFAALLRTGTGR